MTYPTDIEIAQQCEMKPITEIAKTAGIDEKYIEQYGRYIRMALIMKLLGVNV